MVGAANGDLGVLESAAWVVEHAQHVSIDRERAAAVAGQFVGSLFHTPEWDAELHFADGTARTANYVLVLDALNFCFWGEPRWRVEYHGRMLDGYRALAAALKRAIEEGLPLLDAGYLASLTKPQLAYVLRGENEPPLLVERLANLREVGRVLLAKYEGEFIRTIEAAQHSVVRLVQSIVSDFRSFYDVSGYRGRVVRFYKRAQICVADLHGAFGARSWGQFDDLDRLTAFADYKLPQLLRQLGILSYDAALARLVDAREPIPAGSSFEVEIRAATVWGVEYLRQALSERGRDVRAFELDWFLWDLSQTQAVGTQPYHRSRTVYY